MSTCEFAELDGAYVLGSLSPSERQAYEKHLATCESCSRSVRELAGLPGLLARVPVEIVDPEQEPQQVPVPETLLPALVREARKSQRRRRWITSGLVAAAAAIAIGAVGVSTLGGDDNGPPSALPSAGPTTATAVQLHQVGTEAISGWLSLTQVGWGTRLDLTCTYGDADWNDPRWSTYTMYVQTRDGEVERVASWKVVPGKELHIEAATAADTEDISDVQVRTASGATVLELS
jgi:putative zinc finger protein